MYINAKKRVNKGSKTNNEIEMYEKSCLLNLLRSSSFLTYEFTSLTLEYKKRLLKFFSIFKLSRALSVERFGFSSSNFKKL